MTDASVRVPEVSPNVDGREVDCEIIVREGVNYYRQRTEQIGFTDKYGTQQYLAPNGEVTTLPLYKLVGDVFDYSTLDTTTWMPTLVGSGTAVVTAGELVLSTGTTANSSSIVQSTDIARFTGLSPNKERILVQLPDAGVANNIRRWGVDSLARDNGAYFQMSGTTFSVFTRKGGVDTVHADGSASKPFNGQYGATFSPGTTSHFYEIITQPRQVVWLVDNKILHTFNTANEMWTETMNFHIHYENVNSGGSTANVTMKSRLGVISRFGIPEAQPRNTFHTGTTAGTVLKYGPGDFHGIIMSAIGNNSAITLYDNVAASGRILFSSGPMPQNSVPLPLDFGGTSFNIGLTLVVATASSNINILHD